MWPLTWLPRRIYAQAGRDESRPYAISTLLFRLHYRVHTAFLRFITYCEMDAINRAHTGFYALLLGKYALGLDDLYGKDLVAGLAVTLRIAFADGHQDIHTLRHLSKDAVFPVEVWRGTVRDEKL